MTSARRRPISVPEVRAARSMSPVESWTIALPSTSRRAWVPLPAPGGPEEDDVGGHADLCVVGHGGGVGPAAQRRAGARGAAPGGPPRRLARARAAAIARSDPSYWCARRCD
jgi:hypothetical protein